MDPSIPVNLATLRRYAIARTLFAPTTLGRAIQRLGFVQADPIRAPARAQDLTLRHRVTGYTAGDLERRYSRLPIEEDFFVNYGYLSRATQALMHPRTPRTALAPAQRRHVEPMLEFVREQGVVHPRVVDVHFGQGSALNWFGGSSNASTQLLDALHYRGLLRIAGRVNGVRTYAIREPCAEAPDPQQAMDALVDVIVQKYAPLSARSLGELVSRLRHGAPQWAHLRSATLQRAKTRLAQAAVDGQTYFWPTAEDPTDARYRTTDTDMALLLAPFDPLVWDRRRFEHLWGWAYRFEAYTPASKRVRGYYALPLLWREQIIGWGNVSVVEGVLEAELGYVSGMAPRGVAYRQALEEEMERMRLFLRCG